MKLYIIIGHGWLERRTFSVIALYGMDGGGSRLAG